MFDPVDKCLQYSDMKMRRRARWPELYKHRSALADLLTFSDGLMLKDLYVTSAVAANELVATPAQIEAFGYRVRTMMSHLYAARAHGYTPPKTYGSADCDGCNLS